MAKKGRFGPGFLVAAAFVGPGTVTSATLAGADHGFALLWVVVIATAAAVILQEMAGRFSLSTRTDVAAALVKFTPNRWQRIALQILAFLAIVVGCAAYEAGNITGGSLGLEILTGMEARLWAVVIGVAAVLLLIWRNYRVIEMMLIALVVVMGISFFISAFIVKPDLSRVAAGFVPRIPKGSLSLILALLGTTVVPYNLFLHSATVLKKWRGEEDIPAMRKDAFLSIGLGGVITLAIVVTASATYFFQGLTVTNPMDLSAQLTPLFGSLAKVFFGIGFFAAGLSSAITAPYAAAWTASGLFGWKEKDWRFTTVSVSILVFGLLVSQTSFRPLQLIVLAQVTNALLLPWVGLFIFYLLNKSVAGIHRNTRLQNLLFAVVFLIIVLLTVKKFL
jgi:Mn2+/Fe2+ NRAMP family transporter